MNHNDADVLVFDGHCVLCLGSVQFVLRHDRERRYRFATAQSPPGRELMFRHGIDPDQPSSVLLIRQATTSRESDAVLAVLQSFGGIWRLSGVLGLLPKAWRDAAYRFIATRRYRWFGRNESCYVPNEIERHRFLSQAGVRALFPAHGRARFAGTRPA